MTTETSKKIHRRATNRLALAVALVAGAVEALLLARLVARLLAARPDNPAVMVLYGMTNPLVTPFAALEVDQTPFGATLELSTLALASIVPLLAYGLWVALARRNTMP